MFIRGRKLQLPGQHSLKIDCSNNFCKALKNLPKYAYCPILLVSWRKGTSFGTKFFITHRSTHRIALENIMFLISVYYQRCFTGKLFGVRRGKKTPLVPLNESLPAFNKIRLLRNTHVLIANANGASSSTYW